MMKNNAKLMSVFALSSLGVLLGSNALSYDFEVGDTKASVYGYAKLDIVYDVDSKLGNTTDHDSIRVDGQAGSNGHTSMHAYESRLGFTTETPASGSVLKTRIEGDFWPSGSAMRLRHAYGEWNGILAGQTF